MTRDIKQIIKAQYAIPALEKAIGEVQSEVEAWAGKVCSEPAYYMGRCDEQFKNAARIGIYTELIRMFRSSEADGGKGELTLQEIREDALKYMRRCSAIPRSSEATGNLMEQHRLMAWMELADPERAWDHSWMSYAQYEDPEYRVVVDREYAIERVHNAVKAARRKATEKADRWAKNMLSRVRGGLSHISAVEGASCSIGDTPSCFLPYDAETLVDAIGAKEVTGKKLESLFSS